MIAPTLADLTTRFLATAPAEPAPDDDGLFEPYDAAGGFQTDTRTTWDEARFAWKALGNTSSLPVPAGWTAGDAGTRHAIACCVGNYPQQLGELSVLFAAPSLAKLRSTTARAKWAAKLGTAGAAGVLEAARLRAAGLFVEAETAVRGDTTPAGRNELAATLWEAGRHAEAVAAWDAMPASAVRSFNLGMAKLFTDAPAAAVPHLTAACDGLPESGGWNHLAALYLALAESRAGA